MHPRSRTRPSALKRLLRGGVTATVATSAMLSLGSVATATPASAKTPATPGNFTGYGFDQCAAPSQSAMDAWLQNSPFLAAGIYISGDSRGCRSQPNLDADWVRTQLRKGWRLLPITLGPQASCSTHFPRYGDDELISARRGTRGNYPTARTQGRKEATKAVDAAQALGIVPGSTLWYDLEAFDNTNKACRESALAFLSGWTTRMKKLGYVSGAYSSASSGIKVMDDARRFSPRKYNLPTYIWIARWDGVPNTSTSYIGEGGWNPHRRVKQYRGGHNEKWGGVTINIDSNWLDVGKGSVAPKMPAQCGGTRVNFREYSALSRKSVQPARTKALQCMLTQRGFYDGPLDGRYALKTRSAMNDWKAAQGLDEGPMFLREHWTRLLAAGPSPVSKLGSSGESVRRVQRALNAANDRNRLFVTGIFNRGTVRAVRNYQRANGLRSNGVANRATLAKLKRGAR